MTDDTAHLTPILATALEIAAWTPLDRKGARATVPGETIDRLRAQLSAAGIDWRAFRADTACSCGAAGCSPHALGCPERVR